MLGLLLEFIDGVVLVGVHNAEAGSLLHGNGADGDGAVGLHFLMVAQHLGVVHLVDVVAGENQHIVGIIAGNKGDILINGVGRTFVPVGSFAAGVGGQDADAAVGAVQVPGLAIADVLV